jgi:radical SAM superfamily enzyme YgiQ (UPF0313 family)
MRVLLVSTYDLGRQPFGLASPAAWLRAQGADVAFLDLAVEDLDEASIARSDLIAFHLPMHAATRLAARWIPRVRALAPRAVLCCYGLYAAMNERHLRRLGVTHVVGGEFEATLAAWVAELAEARRSGASPVEAPAAVVPLERLEFRPPDRHGLPPLSRYARLQRDGEELLVGYTEASRGCRHRCRHCPIVPVYQGRFRIVPREVVLADARAQIEAGARHVTFGDPDFWNGIGHAIPIVEEFHRRHPDVTYDVTIKIEHLLAHRRHLATLARTGCLFVTSAVESVDDRVLERLDKGHTRADFVAALESCRQAGLTLHPTFVPFTPWTTIASYRDLLAALVALDLVDHVPPIQLAIRLLIPAGSRLLELEDIAALVGDFDEQALVHPWRHADPGVDGLQRSVEARAREAGLQGADRRATFEAIWRIAEHAAPGGPSLSGTFRTEARAPVPYLTEPWYC